MASHILAIPTRLAPLRCGAKRPVRPVSSLRVRRCEVVGLRRQLNPGERSVGAPTQQGDITSPTTGCEAQPHLGATVAEQADAFICEAGVAVQLVELHVARGHEHELESGSFRPDGHVQYALRWRHELQDVVPGRRAPSEPEARAR